MNIKLLSIFALVATVGLFFSHTFAYNSGMNSVTVAIQADALDTVADNVADTKVINTKDSDRYAVLAENHKGLNNRYDKLLKLYKDKAGADDETKYSVCTYDDDTLQLLMDSAAGGKHTGASTSNGSGFNSAIPRTTLAGVWYTSRNHRAYHRERQAILRQSVFTFEPGGSYAGSARAAIRT